jgi:Tfp pilus assembly protein PilO
VSKNKIWTLGLSAAILLVAVFGYVFGVSPILAQASAADQKTQAILTSNQASQSRIVVLRTQFSKIDMLRADLGKLSVSIPAGADMPVFLRELSSLTDQEKVTLGVVTVGADKAYQPPAVPAPVTATGGAGSSIPSPSPSGSAAPVAAGATAVAAAVANAGPSARLLLIPVQVSVTGPYAGVMNFVGALQTGSRLYLASSLTVTEIKETPGNFTGSLIGFVYALPTATAAAATPATGAATTGDAAAAPTK